MRLIRTYNSRLIDLPGEVPHARTVRAGVPTGPIFEADPGFLQAGQFDAHPDAVRELTLQYQFAASRVMADHADPAGAGPSLHGLRSGSAMREVRYVEERELSVSGMRGVRGLGAAADEEAAKVNRCRANFAQTPPQYLDAMTAFVIAAVVRTPTALAERIDSLFGKDTYDCLLAVAKADAAARPAAETKALQAELEQQFLPWLFGKAGVTVQPGRTNLQEATSRWGWGALIVFLLWYSTVLRNNGDRKKVNSVIERGLKMEDAHEWTFGWKASWDKLSAPWYEDPVYLGVGGLAFLTGVWWFAGRK